VKIAYHCPSGQSAHSAGVSNSCGLIVASNVGPIAVTGQDLDHGRGGGRSGSGRSGRALPRHDRKQSHYHSCEEQSHTKCKLSHGGITRLMRKANTRKKGGLKASEEEGRDRKRITRAMVRREASLLDDLLD